MKIQREISQMTISRHLNEIFSFILAQNEKLFYLHFER